MDRVSEIARKDMASVRKYRYVLYGLVVMPIIFAVLMPLALLLPVMNSNIASGAILNLATVLSAKQNVIVSLVSLESLLFMFIPAYVPSSIASYTFTGEKINRQLEPLLATPTSDSELLLGKALGAFVPAIVVTFASFACMMVLVDILTFPLFGYLLLPNLVSMMVLLVYCPLLAMLSVSVSVFVSSKVTDIRAATQLSGVAIIPALGFYFLFLGGLLTLNPLNMALFALLLGAADLGLLFLTKATFQREEILTKWR